MKVIGWCEQCHRIRPVNLIGRVHGPAVQGVCDECAEANERAAKGRTARRS